MMSVYTKKISVTVLALSFLFGTFFTAHAFTIDDNSANLTVKIKGDNERMFNAKNIYPGWNESKDIEVTNNGSSTADLYINFKNAKDDKLAEKIKIYVIRKSDGSYRVGGAGDKYTLEDADKKGALFVASLDQGEKEKYKIKVKFDKEADNKYQGKETKFGIDFQIEGEISDTNLTEVQIASLQGRTVTGEKPEDEKNSEVIAATDEMGNAIDETSNGQVAGVETCHSWPLWVWIIIIIIYTVLAYLIGKGATTKDEKKRNIFWQALFVLLPIIFWYFFDVCRMYNWVVWVSLIIGTIVTILMYKRQEPVVKKTPQSS